MLTATRPRRTATTRSPGPAEPQPADRRTWYRAAACASRAQREPACRAGGARCRDNRATGGRPAARSSSRCRPRRQWQRPTSPAFLALLADRRYAQAANVATSEQDRQDLARLQALHVQPCGWVRGRAPKCWARTCSVTTAKRQLLTLQERHQAVRQGPPRSSWRSSRSSRLRWASCRPMSGAKLCR